MIAVYKGEKDETVVTMVAALQAEFNTSQAFITMFSRVHPYTPGMKIADQDTATIGAYNTSDVPFWFGALDAFNMFRTTRNWALVCIDAVEIAHLGSGSSFLPRRWRRSAGLRYRGRNVRNRQGTEEPRIPAPSGVQARITQA